MQGLNDLRLRFIVSFSPLPGPLYHAIASQARAAALASASVSASATAGAFQIEFQSSFSLQ